MHASGRGRVLGADLEEVLEARREIGVVAVVGSEHLQHSSDQSSRHYSQCLRTERVVLRALWLVVSICRPALITVALQRQC